MKNKGLLVLIVSAALCCVILCGISWFLVYFVNGDLPELETKEYQNLPIQVHDSNTGKVSIERIISNSLSTLHQWLPNATYDGIVYAGTCGSLDKLWGKYSIRFWQKEKILFRSKPRILSATITVDTVSEIMDINIMDASNYYPNITVGIVPKDDRFGILLSMIRDETCIVLKLDDDITITQMTDYWDVRCGKIDTFEQSCSFGIKDKNFEIFQP